MLAHVTLAPDQLPDDADGEAGDRLRFVLTMFFNSFETLKTGTKCSSTSTCSPVRGLRAIRPFRLLTLKLPKPRISMFFPSFNALITVWIKPSTTASVSTFVSPVAEAMTSTMFAFVNADPLLTMVGQIYTVTSADSEFHLSELR